MKFKKHTFPSNFKMSILSFQHLDKLKSSFSNLHAVSAMLNLSQTARHPFTVLSLSLATRHSFAVLSHFLTIRYSWPCQVFLQLPDTLCQAKPFSSHQAKTKTYNFIFFEICLVLQKFPSYIIPDQKIVDQLLLSSFLLNFY